MINWCDAEETILFWKLDGLTTAEEFEKAVRKSYKVVSAKPYIVDVIIDLSNAHGLGFNILRATWQASRTRASNTGIAVVVGETNVWKHLWETTTRMFGKTTHTVRFAETIQQAHSMIAETRLWRKA